MDAVEFIREWQRMCNAHNVACTGCPMEGELCTRYRSVDAERLAEAVEAWSAAHPRKTRQSVFLEQWPNAKVFVDGVLGFCPLELNRCRSTDIEMHCQSCRREFWMQEVE